MGSGTINLRERTNEEAQSGREIEFSFGHVHFELTVGNPVFRCSESYWRYKSEGQV